MEIDTKIKIGIDPDSEKSGVAIAVNGKIIELKTMRFSDLVYFLNEKKEIIGLVVVEAGWLNKSNWHVHPGATIREAASIGNDIGRNHQTGILIVEMCEALNIRCRLSRPQKMNTVKNNAALFNKITGWDRKSNPETRDAAMLVFGL